MTYTLRPYQSEALDAVVQSWEEGINRPVVVLPTGAGKTVCFSSLISRSLEALRAKGLRVLVLAHREELLEQAAEKIRSFLPDVTTCVLKGSRGQREQRWAEVVVASVQTLARPKRREAVDRIGLVITDECHRYASRTYKDVLDHYGCTDDRATPTVGFTATLTRMGGGLPEVWQSVAYSKKIHWMIKQGYLVAPVAKSIEVPGLNLATTRVTAGDLNAKDLAAALEDSEAFTAVAETWCEEASDRPTIVFMPDVATAHRMQEAFKRVCGATAEVITGNTASSDRKAAYGRFRTGETQVLVNCMVLTEGFDAPQTSCVVIGRPTLSPGLYIQMVGRGLRLHPGKTDCLVLDVAGASLKHNLAGVNDLESDCESRCDCNCLRCGCSDRCKCGIRQCGCRCVEQHEPTVKVCTCAGSDACGCGCPGDQDGTGIGACACGINPDCGCRGEGPVPPDKKVPVETLRTLTQVDILGEEVAKSLFTWSRTDAGIDFLQIGKDDLVFLLPAPGGTGFYVGRSSGPAHRAVVTRLDNSSMEATEARLLAEQHAEASGYTYNSRKASWRRTPASEAQLSMLRNLGLTPPEGLRKGEASDMLSCYKASKVLDHRFGKYVAGP